MIDTLAQLDWREPRWVWLAVYPWLAWLVRAIAEWPRGRGYADAGLLPWARARAARRLASHRLWRHAMLALAWLAFALALAGPRLAETEYELGTAQYPELMVVLDVSHSMTARDVEPSRLERARLELHDLIARADKLKIGVVVYAGRPHLLTPPTDDKNVLRHYLPVVRAGLLPTEGSNLADAIGFAARQFGSDSTPRAVLLITDGEAPADAATTTRLEEAVTRLSQQGVALYALGIGTVDGAPLSAPQGGWLRHENAAVVSVLHEERLQRLAMLGNGRYAGVAATDADWRELHDRGIARLRSVDTRQPGDRLVVWRELYAWCLIPATVLFLLAYLEPRRTAASAAPLLLAAILVPGVLHVPPAHAAAGDWERRAFRAYAGEDYREAKRNYARVPGHAGRMGEGGSAYRLGDFREAIRHFTQAILDADSDAQRARALFNLANCHYRLEDYAAAVDLYRETLRYKPEDPAAQTNLGFARAGLERQQRDGDGAAAARQGRGPRTARAPDDMDITVGDVSLDGRDEPRPPVVPEADAQRPLSQAELIERGIRYAQPAAARGEVFRDAGWQYAETPVERIVLQSNALKVDEGLLWQRLFETEEGFPGPVDVPYPLPDLPPW